MRTTRTTRPPAATGDLPGEHACAGFDEHGGSGDSSGTGAVVRVLGGGPGRSEVLPAIDRQQRPYRTGRRPGRGHRGRRRQERTSRRHVAQHREPATRADRRHRQERWGAARSALLADVVLLPPGEPVHLAHEAPVSVPADQLSVGSFVELTLDVTDGELVQMLVPVEAKKGPYADVDVVAVP